MKEDQEPTPSKLKRAKDLLVSLWLNPTCRRLAIAVASYYLTQSRFSELWVTVKAIIE